MQRQSLGLPSSSKLAKDEQQFSFPSSSSSSSSPSPSTTAIAFTGSLLYGRKEEDELLKKKLLRPKPKSAPLETYIHLIPILTLFCFLVLYLSSHDPSPIDLAEFSGFKPRSNLQEENTVSELHRIVDIKKGDVLAVRSLKDLEQAATGLRQRRHRKMARI